LETEPNQHLAPPALTKLLEEARQRGDSAASAAAVHPHLAVCPTCREQFEGLAELDLQLRNMQAGGPAPQEADCPDAEVWSEIAGGLTEPDQTLMHIEHASRCDHCGPLLRAAVGEVADLSEELTDAEREQIAGLESARPEWQLRLAERISGRSMRPGPSWWERWLSVPRFAAVGVTVALLAAVAWWAMEGRGTPEAADQLLARAYTDERTLELRIPGAAYAPLRVQKGPAQSFAGRPTALLKAEALIAGQMASHPDDWAWLQAAGRADLLEGKYDAAVESLQRALELRPDLPELLLDLGTAYFQRAQSEDRQEDYGAAFEYLSKALTLQPENTTALFNRAIVAEHQFLYRQALEDWEHYLKLDSTSQWAEEARSHADAVRTKLKEHEDSGALLSPDQVASASADAKADLERRVEQYLDVAVRSWLPQAYPERGAPADAHAQQALFFLAELTSQKHNDRWLSDLLKGSSAVAFPRAVAGLARASQANSSGDYTAGREQAGIAAQLFSSSGNKAGVLRAQFEQAYSEQLTRRTEECRRDASTALAEAERLPYSWLQIQLGLEKGDCSFLLDDIGVDLRSDRRSMDRAQAVDYDELYVRALSFIADDQIQMGDLSAGLKSAASGLERYWSSRLPARRGYNLYAVLGLATETASLPSFQASIWSEAASVIDSSNNLLARAAAHSYAARAAAAANKPQTAELQYAEATRLFALAPQTEATTDYVLENEIRAAQLESRSGQFDPGIARLTGIQDQIRPRSNNYLVQMFYSTLGELQLRSSHAARAEQAFRPALESAEQRLGSLNTEAERIGWSKESAPVYLGMAEAELVQGHAQESLEYFEWYLGAAARSGERGASGVRATSATPDPAWLASRLPLLTGQTVLAYAALPDGVAIWVYDNRGVNAQWIPQSNQDLPELAARFYDLAADPKSETTALRRDSQSLYRALIGPVEQRLEPGRTLVIEAAGWPAQVPFEALVDSDGHYLIERAAVVHSLGQRLDASLHEGKPISAELRALIVGSAASSQTEGLVPLPDVAAEADAVAGDFQSSTVLKGSKATLSAIEVELPTASVFHFTGHSLARTNGAALMLEAVGAQKSTPVFLNADRLRRLDLRNMQLVVLSTCNTESGKDGSRGFNSIAAALQRAGVPHVVASRWAVDSVAARAFVESFYRYALSGQPVSEAIRQASRTMMADRRTSHPYYWSAFSAYGRP
jgi:CHAT domain-containing protein/cytochrome c-type biogenesis protein CcmH/NrfG